MTKYDMAFLNLALDFPEYKKNQDNPINWGDKDRKQFIKTVSDGEPKRFKKLGYSINDDQLTWSVK